MRNITIVIIISILAILFAGGCTTTKTSSVTELKYKYFPPTLKQMIDKRIAEVNSTGGVCVAGRVKMSDGAHISNGKDVKLNLNQNFDAPFLVYNDGWVLMDRAYKVDDSYPSTAMLTVRAFGYDPIDSSIPLLRGKVTYMEFVMQKTPAEKLASIAGTIVNDQNEPVEGAMVNISFPLSYNAANGHPYMSIATEPNGHYSFEGLSATEYHLWVLTQSGYAASSFSITPIAGKTTIRNHKLYRNLKIVIDYVYQADGNRIFTEGNIKKSTVEWVNGGEGMDFSEGKVKGYEPKSLRDLEMRQSQDRLNFYVTYGNGKGSGLNYGRSNGFYDAGEVNFESVTEAAESGYAIGGKPCLIGHVYVVRTFENNYAKFIVRSISENK
jgi:hypothetical protein